VRWRQAHPVWNEVITVGKPEEWDLDKTQIRLSLFDTDRVKGIRAATGDKFIGEATVTVRDLIKRTSRTLLMSTRDGAPVLSSKPPHLPCEIDVSVLQPLPESWPEQLPLDTDYTKEDYPKHVFVMTRGTRGDVQPFVALARGMASELGWMVTICTELKWKDFVMKNADVPRGKIRYRPSGGDTDKRVQKASAQWAMNSKGEVLQSLMLAFAEAEFFDSGPVFVHHLLRMQVSRTPVDLIMFSFTTAGVGLLASERCSIPCAGFILQPSCIPSKDPDWKAIVAIDSHAFQMLDRLEETYFTSHDTLEKLKGLAESGFAGKHSLRNMRKDFGLRPAPTWKTIGKQDIPLIIPMAPGSFRRPDDWGKGVQFTDFIFLRRQGPGASKLGEPADSFIEKAKAAGQKLIVMTFSSMPVKRQRTLQIATKILKECKFPCALLYVGARQQDTPPAALLKDTDALTEEGRLLELTAVDFGVLFTMADAFIVHGGLGTTVEAFRAGKPVAVTGPLLMDQRFWGGVAYNRGVGPMCLHVDDFHTVCVEYANNALDPADPAGYQSTSHKLRDTWGQSDSDGVQQNVLAFKALIDQQACQAIDTSNMTPFSSMSMQKSPPTDVDMSPIDKTPEQIAEGGSAQADQKAPSSDDATPEKPPIAMPESARQLGEGGGAQVDQKAPSPDDATPEKPGEGEKVDGDEPTQLEKPAEGEKTELEKPSGGEKA